MLQAIHPDSWAGPRERETFDLHPAVRGRSAPPLAFGLRSERRGSDRSWAPKPNPLEGSGPWTNPGLEGPGGL